MWGGGGGDGGSPSVPTSQLEDPLFKYQWHLQTGLPGRIDINVSPVWAEKNEGAGVVVAVVDDGVEIGHEDLVANIYADRSLNLEPTATVGVTDPSPQVWSQDHGTAVAGLIAAARNTVGGRGVAPQAKLIGINLLQNFNATNTAIAMLHADDIVDISNNSWGNVDGTGELGYVGPLWRQAVNDGVIKGRNGKGIVYLFAAGNGGESAPNVSSGERSNYDAYNNHYGVLNIGAVDAEGNPFLYSEPGANVLVSAPSGASGASLLPQLFTTAIMGSYAQKYYQGRPWLFPNYRYNFNGTSGATPIVSGVVALMLKANPNLSWRDIRWILAATARPIAVNKDRERGSAAIGKGVYSHQVGFGIVDAAAAVRVATTFSLLPPLKTCTIKSAAPVSIAASGSEIQKAYLTLPTGCGISTIESVDVDIDIGESDENDFIPTDNEESLVGNLDIRLYSPSGNVSIFATRHPCYDRGLAYSCEIPYTNWTFNSVRHLGESIGDGQWGLYIQNTSGRPATLKTWSITVLGY